MTLKRLEQLSREIESVKLSDLKLETSDKQGTQAEENLLKQVRAVLAPNLRSLTRAQVGRLAAALEKQREAVKEAGSSGSHC